MSKEEQDKDSLRVPKKVTKIVQDAVSSLESKCELLPKRDYRLVLEEVIASLQGNLDCVTEELKAECEDD